MDEELVYLAGFIDGEGSIRIGTNKSANGQRRWYLIFSCHQLNPVPLRLLAKRFGGSVRRQDVGRHRPIFEWTVTAKMAYGAIGELRPWLIVKADEADAAMAFQASLKHEYGRRAPLTAEEKESRERAYLLLRSLKQRNHDET